MTTIYNGQQEHSIPAYRSIGEAIRLDYDVFTPRPHFIVLQEDRKSEATHEDLASAYRVIAGFLQENPRFDDNAILSFHRGRWYQQHTNDWHAHLCVAFQPYVERATTAIQPIPMNRQWSGAQNVEDGLRTWRDEKLKIYQKYKEACIRRHFSFENRFEQLRLNQLDETSADFQLAWTTPTPRVAVIDRLANVRIASLSLLYDFISSVYQKIERNLGSIDPKFVDFGSHLCLYVSGTTGTNVKHRSSQIFDNNGRKIINENVVGYIQMHETQYLCWIPRCLREIWREDFQQAEHFVET